MIPDADSTLCTCVDTLRGTDTYGCPLHDPTDPDPASLPDGRREVLQEQIL